MEGRVRQGILGGNKFMQVVYHALLCFANLPDLQVQSEGFGRHGACGRGKGLL